MQLAFRTSRHVESSATRALGREHPLTHVLDEQASFTAEIVLLSGLSADSVVAAASGYDEAVPVAVAAALVDLVWCGRALALLERRRDLVLELLVAGCGRLQIDVVERERSRLLDERRRRQLAAWLRSLADGSDLTLGGGGTLPRISRRTIESCRRELLDVASLVIADAPDVAGVALLELLVSHGTSPLHGDEPAALGQELRRIRYLLCPVRGPATDALR